MAITFTTKSGPNITMLDANAKQVLDIIGKELGTRGVITAGEAQAAAERLKAAGAGAKAQAAQQGKTADADSDDAATGGGDRVPLHVRALPFIDMLENAARQKQDILWGV
jgi:Domain of unknown function (DUF1840)